MIPGRRFYFYNFVAIAMLFAVGSSSQALAQGSTNRTVPSEIENYFQSGRLILMGEVHGTAEAPVAFGAVVSDALEHGQMLSVGLELFPDQSKPLAVYLASNGDKTAVAQLLHSSFWTRSFQDGRSSVAMLELVERLRALKQRYPDLVMFVLEDDVGVPPAGAGFTRDQRMAARVRVEHERRSQALVVTLSGNIHSRLTSMLSGPDGPAIAPPMGTFLTDLAPRSVLLAQTGGTAWTCTPECGVHAWPAQGKSLSGPLPAYRKLTSADPYSDEWLLGPSTASGPAVQAPR